MATSTSIAELQRTGITLRAGEAVAIVQQLIHTPLDGDSPIEAPFGPPSPQNIYVDDDGCVVCRGCKSTPAVSEIAIVLQAMLPVERPGVPGALRYTIARALLEVDAPPFDSILELSQALARFESGDRTAVVRALVARALRHAAARYHALVEADSRVVPFTGAAQPAPERRPTSTLAVGVAVGLCLIRVGEFMHTRSTLLRAPAGIVQPASDRVLTPIAPQPRQDEARVPSTPAAVPVATTGSRPVRVDKAMKPVAKRSLRPATPATAPRARGAKDTRGIMDRLRLRWLRNAFTVRSEPLRARDVK